MPYSEHCRLLVKHITALKQKFISSKVATLRFKCMKSIIENIERQIIMNFQTTISNRNRLVFFQVSELLHLMIMFHTNIHEYGMGSNPLVYLFFNHNNSLRRYLVNNCNAGSTLLCDIGVAEDERNIKNFKLFLRSLLLDFGVRIHILDQFFPIHETIFDYIETYWSIKCKDID